MLTRLSVARHRGKLVKASLDMSCSIHDEDLCIGGL